MDDTPTCLAEPRVARNRDDMQRLAFVCAAIAEGKLSGLSNRTLPDIIANGRQRHVRR